MNSKLAVAYSAKKMAKKKIDAGKDLDYMKAKCYAEGGLAPDPEKAQKFQKSFGYDKPVSNDTFDDKVRNFIADKIAMKANGGMVKEDEPIEEAPMAELHMDDDFLSDEMKEPYDEYEPSVRKKMILSKILNRIRSENME